LFNFPFFRQLADFHFPFTIMHIKKGDTVKILTGDDKGKTGKVVKAFPADNKVVIEGVNTVKKHERSRRQDGKGQVVERAMPIHASNVAKVN
jgi:large subunit ribosomal protein L24